MFTAAGAPAAAAVPTAPASFPSQLQNKKLVDLMDGFRTRLGGQVNLFSKQAAKVDAWDRQLVKERDRALQLHETTDQVTHPRSQP